MSSTASDRRLRVIAGASADTLATIARPDVKLAIWDRQCPFTLTPAAAEGFPSLCVTADVDAAAHDLAKVLASDLPARGEILADVDHLARRFAAITGTARVAIRLDRIDGNACWKFHADYVPVRLLCTYLGPGTQWLRDQDATQPQQLATGAVGVFKGRELAPDDPIIHRSPPIAGTGETRLLLVIDPVAAPPA